MYSGQIIALLCICMTSVALSKSPQDCISEAQTMHGLSVCFGSLMNGKQSTSQINGPSVDEHNAFKGLVKQMLTNGNGVTLIECSAVTITGILADKVNIAKFTSPVSGKQYCILYEKTQNDKFPKGWAWVAVPMKSGDVTRNLHFSAAHPITDTGVDHQAAALFERVGARSLVVSGARRDQSTVATTCQDKPGTDDYYTTDAAHDTSTMFHHAALAVYEWHFENLGTCPSGKCAFIQLHGMAADTCPGIDVFISGGIYRSTWSISKFHSRPDLPVNLLEDSFNSNQCNDWNVQSVRNNDCAKRGTQNVLGRVINGVTQGTECTAKPSVTSVPGYFVHIEQTSNARTTDGYDCWEQAIKSTFGTI